MRQKLRSPQGRQAYAQRKAIVELGFGVLKEQRGMRQFRTRGKEKVAIEFTLANLAYNLTRMYSLTTQHPAATNISLCWLFLCLALTALENLEDGKTYPAAKAGYSSAIYGTAEAVPFRASSHADSQARNFIAQCLSAFENPLPRTKVRGYTRTSVFKQAVKLCPSLKTEFSRGLVSPGAISCFA